MTPERFHQIVEAYGADARRWPQQERAAAQAWAALHRAEADAVLADAAGIDAWLAADKVDPPGAAVAGVGLLGGAAGAFAVSFFVLTGTVQPVHESSYLTSSFGGSSADWSGE